MEAELTSETRIFFYLDDGQSPKQGDCVRQFTCSTLYAFSLDLRYFILVISVFIPQFASSCTYAGTNTHLKFSILLCRMQAYWN